MEIFIMKEKWDIKYSNSEYFFGKEPNSFFKEEIDKMEPGKALFLGEGEGRNSVYATKLGWITDSIDISEVGKTKAEKLADENNVSINYIVNDVLLHNYPKDKYDAVVVIFFHVEEIQREFFFSCIKSSLKHGGKIIFLVYEEDNLKLGQTGPNSLSVHYKLKDFTENFINYDFELFSKENRKVEKKGIIKDSVVVKFVAKKQ